MSKQVCKSCLKMSTLLVPLKKDINRLRDEIIAIQHSRSDHDTDPENRHTTRTVHGVKTLVRTLNVKALALNSKFFAKLLKNNRERTSSICVYRSRRGFHNWYKGLVHLGNCWDPSRSWKLDSRCNCFGKN